MAGAGAAFVYSGSIGSALKWFKEGRGLASGIMAAGFGGGTALFIPFISSMLESSGHRATFVATGVLQGLVILIVAQFLRHPAAEAISAKPTAGGAAQLGKRQFTTLEMLRTPQFYVLYISFVLMATGGLLVTANAGPMARYETGSRTGGYAEVTVLHCALHIRINVGTSIQLLTSVDGRPLAAPAAHGSSSVRLGGGRTVSQKAAIATSSCPKWGVTWTPCRSPEKRSLRCPSGLRRS